MQQLARQAQKLQQQMAKMQEDLEAREYEASAGGGMVSVKVNGKKELLAVEYQARSRGSRRRRDASGSVMAAVNEALRAGDGDH